MKKIRYTLSLIFIIMLTVSMSVATAFDSTLTVTDETGDVSYFNVDIENVTCTQSGTEVEVQLKLAEGGRFEKSEETSYGIYLFVASPSLLYFILYTGADLSDIPELGELGEVIVFRGFEDFVDVNDYDVTDNVLTVSFDLEKSNERVVGILASAEKYDDYGNGNYSDSAPDDVEGYEIGNIEVDAGGFYEANVSEIVYFKGDLIEGNPSDYTWYWLFNGSLLTFEEQNPTYEFDIPGNYEGYLFVYDGKGNWGFDVFSVTVNKKGGSNGNGNNQPGFELIVFITAIAVSLLILKKRK